MHEERGNKQGERRSKRHTKFCGKTYWMLFGRVRLKERTLISTILNIKYGCTLDSFGSEHVSVTESCKHNKEISIFHKVGSVFI